MTWRGRFFFRKDHRCFDAERSVLSQRYSPRERDGAYMSVSVTCRVPDDMPFSLVACLISADVEWRGVAWSPFFSKRTSFNSTMRSI